MADGKGSSDPCIVHNEDGLVRELYEAKLALVTQRLDDFMASNAKAAEHVARELDRRLQETNGFKEEMSKQVSTFMTRREAMGLMTLIATVVSLIAMLIKLVGGGGGFNLT